MPTKQPSGQTRPATKMLDEVRAAHDRKLMNAWFDRYLGAKQEAR